MRQLVYFLLFSTAAFSQQPVSTNLININRVLYNPGITGSTDQYSVFFANKSDIQFKYNLVQASLFLPALKLGTGISAESYQSLLETQINYTLNLSYRLKAKNGFWQFGLAPVVHNFKLNTDNLNVRNAGDGSVPGQNLNSWTINYNAGLIFKNKKLLFSFAAQNIASNSGKRQQDYAWIANQTSFSAYLSYTILFGNAWKYVPSVYYQYYDKSSFAALSNQLIYKFLFIGFQYGFYSNCIASFGFMQEEMGRFGKLYAGYSFSSRSLGISRVNAHEFFVSISFGKGDRGREEERLKSSPVFHSPIYF